MAATPAGTYGTTLTQQHKRSVTFLASLCTKCSRRPGPTPLVLRSTTRQSNAGPRSVALSDTAMCVSRLLHCSPQSVDIFAKQFLLVPIHEGLHWSLAIVCFPSHQRDVHPDQIPCILHFDSLACTLSVCMRRLLMALRCHACDWHVSTLTTACHETKTIAAVLLDYLTLEWEHKVRVSRHSACTMSLCTTMLSTGQIRARQHPRTVGCSQPGSSSGV